MTKHIAVLSMARNDEFFIKKWINYYGTIFGQENLFLLLDGHDQPLPHQHEKMNVIRLPHLELNRTKGDRNRARLISYFAKSLFHRYDIVIAHDIDEFIVIDPLCNQNLDEYLQQPIKTSTLSALGLDVGQHVEKEKNIDSERPFLEQRDFAHVSARYTKPAIAARPITWGSGFHRVKGKNFHIDPNLFLFHFGMIDYNVSKEKTSQNALVKAGWKGHFNRRNQLFDLIKNNVAMEGDNFFKTARKRQTIFRPFYALNKPGTLKEKPIVKIPRRFKSIL